MHSTFSTACREVVDVVRLLRDQAHKTQRSLAGKSRTRTFPLSMFVRSRISEKFESRNAAPFRPSQSISHSLVLQRLQPQVYLRHFPDIGEFPLKLIKIRSAHRKRKNPFYSSPYSSKKIQIPGYDSKRFTKSLSLQFHFNQKVCEG